MSPDANQTPGLGLPPPATAQSGPVRVGQMTAPDSGAQAVAGQSMPDDGSEVIDEEWVNKAKAIVDQTKNDPFLESQELSKVRAGYLKARYNKDIKVSEDHD